MTICFQFVCQTPKIPNQPQMTQNLFALADTLENATGKVRTAQPTWTIKTVNQIAVIDLP